MQASTLLSNELAFRPQNGSRCGATCAGGQDLATPVKAPKTAAPSTVVTSYQYEASFSFSDVRSGGARVLSFQMSEKFSGLETRGTTPYQPFVPPSPEETANRVLGFVEQRLQKEADAGASTERLASLLAGAREGVEKGFGQARDDIEAMGLMNDKLSGEIDDSYARIQTGLDALDRKFVAGENATPVTPPAAPAPQVPTAPVQSTAPAPSNPAPTTPAPAPGTSSPITELPSKYRAGISTYTGQRESLGLEILTRDGDRIRVSYEQLQEAFSSTKVNYRAGEDGGKYSEKNVSASQFAQNLSLQVDGTLDEGEMQALHDLLTQVSELATTFFGGDFNKAFDQASTLQMDSSELAEFSLNMKQTRTTAVSAYEQIGGGRRGNDYAPLGDFAKGMQQAVDKASLFADPINLMKQLFDKTFALQNADAETSRPTDPKRDFLQTLLDRLAA